MPALPSPTSTRRPDPAEARPKRLGLFGGTFDPPHIGHVVAAVWVGAELALDEVWLVVANRPWQKVGAREITPIADRWALVQAAADGVEGVVASDIELQRGGDSYTIDTVDAVRATDPGTEVFVIVGADAAAGLRTWHRCEDLRVSATVVVVDRPGAPSLPAPADWPVTRIDIPRLDVASTDLRRRVAAGRPVDGLVPPAVCDVIRRRGLYRGPIV